MDLYFQCICPTKERYGLLRFLYDQPLQMQVNKHLIVWMFDGFARGDSISIFQTAFQSLRQYFSLSDSFRHQSVIESTGLLILGNYSTRFSGFRPQILSGSLMRLE